MAVPRVGLGFDAHPFADGRALVLGGLAIEHPQGLAGHSDGDVVCHAIVDALLGAAGLGDIGTHFPSSDERWRGASSLGFLTQAATLVRGHGYEVGNVDCTVVCEAPAIVPHREKMELTIADALGVGAAQVSVKATSTDRMGFTGRGEGIAAMAVALLVTS